MLLYCPPLDIDLSYSAFVVHSHFSADRFDALTIAMKTQLGSWERHSRDLDKSESETLQELLLKELNRQGAFNGTENKDMVSSTPHTDPLYAGVDQTRGDERTESDLVQGKQESKRNQISEQRKMRRNPGVEITLRCSLGLLPITTCRSKSCGGLSWYLLLKGRAIITSSPQNGCRRFTTERLLMQQPRFHQFSWKPLEMLRDLPLGPSYCSPPSSLLSYLYPSERGGKIYYDGMGPDLADIQCEFTVKKVRF